MKRQARGSRETSPRDDRWRHVTKEQFDQALKEIIRDIKLRSALEEFERWSPPKGARPN
jgi:hypothetical protein